MFLGYLMKSKAYSFFNCRTKTIVKCKNVRIDEKFGTKEKMIGYNSNEEESNPRVVSQNAEVLFKTNNDLQNDVLTFKHRGEQSSEPREEIRVEMSTPTPNKNMTRNHPPEQIIGSKDKGIMTRNKINEEICLISQVEPKCIDEVVKDNHWIQAMKEELDQIVKNDTWELVMLLFENARGFSIIPLRKWHI